MLYIWEVMTLQTVSSLTVLATDVTSSLSLTINGVPAMFNVPTTNHRVTVASYATTTDIGPYHQGLPISAASKALGRP